MVRKKISVGTTICLMVLVAGTVFSIMYIRFGLSYNARKYIEVWEAVEKFIGEYDENELMDIAYSAILSNLDDNWTYYLTAEQYQSYLKNSNNQYAGIGVVISKDEETGGLMIQSIYEDSPAEKAELQIGEIIVAVEGMDITEMTTSEARALIGEKLGTSLVITILGTDGARRDVELNCELIYTNPISFQMLDGDIGYITIDNFENGVATEFTAAVEELIAEGAEALIFDVRFNPGGKVSEMVEMLDYLLPEGDLFISKDKNGNENVDKSDASCIELPMAVLMNSNSYSAAEFFAAALSEYGWAETVGEHTTGKGRSQNTFALSDGSAVHISTREYFTPSGVSLAEVGGLAPDHDVELSDEKRAFLSAGKLETIDDGQLQKAIEVLQS